MPVGPLSTGVDAANVVNCAPGWYGKIAMLGDFAHRRLPSDFIRLGDEWLSRAMRASREQFGDRWPEPYLTAPVLRFAWAPGVAGSTWWFGVLMPSCDNVGRYFPLLIAAARAGPPGDRIACDHLEAWLACVAAAATRTLDERASVEGFEAALREAPPWPSPGPSPDDRRAGPGDPSLRSASDATLPDWLHRFACEDLRARLAACSIWSRPGNGGEHPTLRVIQGLPDPLDFAAMLSGD